MDPNGELDVAATYRDIEECREAFLDARQAARSALGELRSRRRRSAPGDRATTETDRS